MRTVKKIESSYMEDGKRVSMIEINGAKYMDKGDRIHAYFESIAQEL